MKLIDLQHEQGQSDFPMPDYAEGTFPCGCRLRLDQNQLEKLGIKQPEAGTSMRLEAVAVVTRSSTEDPDADGDIDCVCVELQLVKLGIEEGHEPEEEEDGEDGEHETIKLTGDDEKDENAVDRRARKASKLWGKRDAKASK